MFEANRSTAPETVDIWMAFYPRAYLAKTGRLTTEQHGAYVLLILDYWLSGPLPDDDETLRGITKLDAKSWRKSAEILRNFFFKKDGKLFHNRIEKELGKARERAARAKKGAASRWAGHVPSNAQAIAQANASHMPEDIPGDMLDPMLDRCTSPSPSPSQEVVTQPASVNGLTLSAGQAPKDSATAQSDAQGNSVSETARAQTPHGLRARDAKPSDDPVSQIKRLAEAAQRKLEHQPGYVPPVPLPVRPHVNGSAGEPVKATPAPIAADPPPRKPRQMKAEAADAKRDKKNENARALRARNKTPPPPW